MNCGTPSKTCNKEKVADAMRPVTEADLIAGKYLLVQRGKKNYYLVTVE